MDQSELSQHVFMSYPPPGERITLHSHTVLQPGRVASLPVTTFMLLKKLLLGQSHVAWAQQYTGLRGAQLAGWWGMWHISKLHIGLVWWRALVTERKRGTAVLYVRDRWLALLKETCQHAGDIPGIPLANVWSCCNITLYSYSWMIYKVLDWYYHYEITFWEQTHCIEATLFSWLSQTHTLMHQPYEVSMQCNTEITNFCWWKFFFGNQSMLLTPLLLLYIVPLESST